MPGYSVTFSVVDQATEKIEAINKQIRQLREPLDRQARAMNKLVDEAGLKKIADGFGEITRSALESFDSLGRLVPLFSALTGPVAIAGLVKLTNTFADWSRTLEHGATLAGTSADRFQELQNAVKLIGGNADDATKAMLGIEKTLHNIVTGQAPQAAMAYRRAGIAWRDSTTGMRLHADAVFPKVLGYLSQLKEAQDVEQEASRLGAEGMAEIVRDLKAGGITWDEAIKRSEKLGVVNEDNRKKLNEYRKAVGALDVAFTNLGGSIAGAVAPWLVPVLEKVAKNIDLIALAGEGVATIFAVKWGVRAVAGIGQAAYAVTGLNAALKLTELTLGRMLLILAPLIGAFKLIRDIMKGPPTFKGEWDVTKYANPAYWLHRAFGGGAAPQPGAPAAAAPGGTPIPGGVEAPLPPAAPTAPAAPAAPTTIGPSGMPTTAPPGAPSYTVPLQPAAPGGVMMPGAPAAPQGGAGMGGMAPGAGVAAPGVPAAPGAPLAPAAPMPPMGMPSESAPSRPGPRAPAAPSGPGGAPVPPPSGAYAPGPAGRGSLYAQRAGLIVTDLQNSLGLTREQAAGLVGNLGYESGGFKSLQEIAPRGGGRGGYGYAQWTGPRRRNFEAWAKEHNLDPRSHEANVGFLKHELQSPEYAPFLAQLRQARSIEEASHVTHARFERSADAISGRFATDPQRANYGRQAYALAAPEPGGGPMIAQGPRPGVVPASARMPMPPGPGGRQSRAADVVDQMVGLAGTRGEAVRQFLRDPRGVVQRDPDLGLWCAEFTNAYLQHAGVRGSGSLMAASFSKWGEQVDPQQVAKGDVLLNFNRKHVGVATGRTRTNEQGQLEIEEISSNSLVNGEVTNLPGLRWRKDVEVRRSRELAAAQAPQPGRPEAPQPRGEPVEVDASARTGGVNGSVDINVTHRNPPPGSSVDAKGKGDGVRVKQPRIEEQIVESI